MATALNFDDAHDVPYSELHDRKRMPRANHFIIERHAPNPFGTPFHHHTSVEVNFLEDCDLTYSFSGVPVEIGRGELVVFWGAQPHRVTEVADKGRITNIYLSLGQFLRWGLPVDFTHAILTGCVVRVVSPDASDTQFFDRLWRERREQEAPWRRMHLDEIEARLRRIGLQGWKTLLKPDKARTMPGIGPRTMHHVEALLRCIADNYTESVSVEDIAASVNMSASRANALFRQVMGVSIKKHLTRSRLSHARMLLQETDRKILSIALDSGYKSASSFYAAFAADTGMPPERFRRQGRRSANLLAG